MAVQITIDQGVLPPGTPGKAREDLSLWTPVVLTSSGGPFAAYLWRILHGAVDIDNGVKSSAILTTPTAPSTQVNPVDVEGTYLIELVVDSGNGLGASEDDIARITFYVGTALASDPWDLPRRVIAFKETTEHNVNDALDPTGNPEGYAREMERWFSVIRQNYRGKSWAHARVDMLGGFGFPVRSFNLFTSRLGVGWCQAFFNVPMPNADYSVIGSPRNTPGSVVVANETTNGFDVYRFDSAGLLVDDDFSIDVKLGE